MRSNDDELHVADLVIIFVFDHRCCSSNLYCVGLGRMGFLVFLVPEPLEIERVCAEALSDPCTECDGDEASNNQYRNDERTEGILSNRQENKS